MTTTGSKDAALVCEGLGKQFGELTALESLDLTVAAGELVTLLGPNGAGKTTAISMMTGVLPPTRGHVRILGSDVWRRPVQAKRSMGLVPQELALYDSLTARENLEFFGHAHGLDGANLLQRMDWALDVAGLASRADEPVARYSGGMKRRLNLVTGLLHDPKVIILDEPTSGVDAHSRAHIFDSIRRMRDEGGAAILHTTHYMAEVEDLCDRVVILDSGRVIAAGTAEARVAEHGDQTMELRVDGDLDDFVGVLAEMGDVSRANGAIRVRAGASLAAVVAAVEREGGAVREARAFGGDLEAVFLHLTGRELRDG